MDILFKNFTIAPLLKELQEGTLTPNARLTLGVNYRAKKAS